MKKPSSLLCTLGLAASAALMTLPARAQEAGPGDAAAGAKKVAMCMGCHGILGYRSSFPEVYRVPKISGQSATYLSTALNEYKKGDRRHPTMRSVAASLSDQDIADVSAFYAADGKNLPSPPARELQPNAQVSALLTKGNCLACHGKDLQSPIDGTYPKLAGQYADYLLATLQSYQTDNNALIGRDHAVMGAQSRLFKRSELKVLSDYIASLPGTIKTVPQARLR